MRTESLMTGADDCRRHAADLAGRPEASMLLRIAGYFEALATQSTGQLTVPDATASQAMAR
jgi:hypothetical protein